MTDEARIKIDPDDWETELPPILERLSSTRTEIRCFAVHSLYGFFAGHFVGSDLDPYLDDLVSALIPIIADPFTISEHNECVNLLGLLCLQRFTAFDPYARTVIATLLPDFGSLPEDRISQYFGVAVLAAFGLATDDDRLSVLERYINLITNKKSRSVEFSARMIGALVSSVTLLIGAYPVETVSPGVLAEIAEAADGLLASGKRKILVAAVETIAVLHDCLTVAGESTIRYAGDFGPRLAEVPGQVSKKTDRRELAARCAEIREIFEGAEDSEEIDLNSQTVRVVGARHRVVVDAVRRVSGDYFQQQMCENQLIHGLLGIRLKGRAQALREKRRVKGAIEVERATTKKAKELEIAARRKKKSRFDDV